MSKKEEKTFTAFFPAGKVPNESELAAMGLELGRKREIEFASPAEFILKWARRGDWNSLADYLAGGGRTTSAIREFLIEVLRQQAGKPNNRASSLRTLAGPGGLWSRVLYFFMLLEDGLGRERAITATAERFGVDRRTISRNIKDGEAGVRLMVQLGMLVPKGAVNEATAAGPRYLISSTALTPHFLS